MLICNKFKILEKERVLFGTNGLHIINKVSAGITHNAEFLFLVYNKLERLTGLGHYKIHATLQYGVCTKCKIAFSIGNSRILLTFFIKGYIGFISIIKAQVTHCIL